MVVDQDSWDGITEDEMVKRGKVIDSGRTGRRIKQLSQHTRPELAHVISYMN